jgi:hypothetical protein
MSSELKKALKLESNPVNIVSLSLQLITVVVDSRRFEL